VLPLVFPGSGRNFGNGAGRRVFNGRSQMMVLQQRLIRALAGIALILILGSITSLNVSGFCYAHLRYYPNSSLTDSAVTDDLKFWNLQDKIEYRSLGEFYEQNPKCCKVIRWNFPEFDFLSRLLGFYVAVVDIWYKSTNGSQDNFFHAEIFVDSCGGIRRRTGIPESSPRPVVGERS
jgi:hypothetical protein